MSLGEHLDLVIGISAGVAAVLALWSRVIATLRWAASHLAPVFGIANVRSVENGFADMRSLIESMGAKLDELATSRKEVDDSLGHSVDGIRDELSGLGRRLDAVEYQLKPNHGGSLRDHVTRLEGKMDALLRSSK